MGELAIQKVYDIKTVGLSETIDSFEKLNKQFIEMKKNKIAFGDLSVGDNGQLQELNQQLKAFTGNASDMGQVGNKAFKDIAQSMEKMNGVVTESIIGFTKFTQAMSSLPTLAKDISDANKNMASGTQAVSQAENNQSDVTAKLISIQAQYGKSIGENAAKLAQMKVELADTTKEIANSNKMIEKQVGNIDNNVKMLNQATLRQQELKVEIAQTTQAMKTEIKEVMAASGSMDEMSQTLFQLKEQYRALSAEQRENANVGGVLQSKITVLDEEIKMLDVSIGNHQRLVGSYAKALADAGLNAATLTAKLAELKAAGQEDTAAFQQMNVELDMWNAKVAKFSLSNGSSTLGATTFAPTFQGQLKSVKADMYALAEAGKVDTEEFRALSLQAQQLTAKITEVEGALRAQTTTMERYGNRFVSLFERMGIRMVFHLVMFQVIMEAFNKIGEAWQAMSDRINYKQIAMDAVAKEAASTFAKEAAELEGLKTRFNDVATTMSDKQEIVKELNDKYKDQIGVINGVSDAEKFFVEKSGVFIKALDLRAQAQASLTVIGQQYQKQMEAMANPEGTLDWVDKMAAGFRAIGVTIKDISKKGGGEGADLIGGNYDWEKGIKGSINANKTMNDTSKTIDLLLKQYADLQNAARKLDKDNGFNSEPGDKNKTKNNIAAGINELLEARKRAEAANAEAQKQQFELQAANNKAIYEDDKNTLQDRLDAYNAFQQAQIMIATIDSAKEVAIVEDKLKALLEKEKQYKAGKITLSKDAVAALKLDWETYATELTTKEDDLNIKIAEKKAQGILAVSSINKSDKEKQKRLDKEYSDSEQSALQDRLTDFETAYNDEAAALANSYLNKEISEKEFQKRLKKLKNDFDITTLTEKIAQDNFLLNDGKAKDDKELAQIKSRLAAEGYALTNANIVKTELARKDDELKKKITDGAFEVAQEAEQQYFQMMQRRLDMMDKAEQRALDFNKKQTDSQVQSNQQKIASDKAYDLAQQQLEKDKLLRQRQLAKQQMAIDYALAVMKIWSVQSVDIPIAIADTAVVTGMYAAKLAMMDKYGDGGDVPNDGGVFGGRSHSNGGTPFSFGGRTSIAEAGELAIINKRSSASNQVLNISGTPKQIASGINAWGGGKNFAPGARMYYGYPGTQGAQLHAPAFITNQQIARADEMQAAKAGAAKADQTHAMIISLAGTVNDLANTVSAQSSMQVVLDPHSVTDFQNKHSKSVNVSGF